jgi:hypothetical protein
MHLLITFQCSLYFFEYGPWLAGISVGFVLSQAAWEYKRCPEPVFSEARAATKEGMGHQIDRRGSCV